MARVTWQPEAARNLDDIVEYLAGADATAYADELTFEIERAITHLAQFPMMGRVVPEFNRPDLREVIIDKYRLVYRHRGEDIRVIAFWHASSDIASKLRRMGLN